MLLNGIEAMSATPREGRYVAIRTETTDRQIQLSVSDRGHGIRAEAVSRSSNRSTRTKAKAWGLASIARTIVEAHGGRIAAQNNADGGVTVWFMLPSREVA